MRQVFTLPDVGEGLTEAEILSWRVGVGDTVEVNQIIVEIETAKAAVELPSPYAGTVAELLARPGDTVEVGTPIIAIGDGAAEEPAGEAAGAKIGEVGAGGRVATLVGYGPKPGSVTRRPRKTGPRVADSTRVSRGFDQAAPAAEPPAPAAEPRPPAPTSVPRLTAEPAPPESEPAPPESEPAPPEAEPATADAAAAAGLVPLAKPPVRKLAKDLGVDLRALTGSGANGLIIREDVERAAAGAEEIDELVEVPPEPAPPPRAEPGTDVRRVPIRGVRKATAAAMVESAFTAPHVTEFLTVDVTPMMELRERLRATAEFRDVRLSPLAFAAKAVCLAVRRTPEVNASWDEAAQEIVYYDRVQLGIAAATPRGLIVPKVRDADRLSLRELAEALGRLTETARAGKTPPGDLVGGTFTITNVGVFGVDTGTPILNPGESAILALGAVKQAPWVVDGQLAVRTVCQLALSFDHRVVDGEQGSRFLADVGALLADPGRALTY